MGESSTSSAMCKVCGHRHPFGPVHVWGDDQKAGKKAKVISELRASIVNSRSSSTVEPVICNHQVEGSIPSSGPKRDSGPMTTITHPVSTNVPATVVTATDGDMTWVEAMPWRHPVRQPMSNMPEGLEGIPLLLDKDRLTESNKPVVLESNRKSNIDLLESNKSNKPKFDKKAYQRDLMRKRRAN